MSRNISAKDYKLLYSRSAGRCNICGIEVFQKTKSGNEYTHYGEMAHNTPFSDDQRAPRAESKPKIIDKNSTDNSYFNLILLCSNDHHVVDQDTKFYDVNKLKEIKNDFEIYVESLFKRNQSKDIPILEAIREFCDFQSIYSNLRDPLYYIPFDICDIANIYENYLMQNYPTHYPFEDNFLTETIENIYKSHLNLHNYVIKYYECRGPSNNLYPYKERDKQMSANDENQVKEITDNLRKYIFKWLIHVRKNYSIGS